MTVALLTSLVLALTWTPSLSQFFVRRKSQGEVMAPAMTQQEELQRRHGLMGQRLRRDAAGPSGRRGMSGRRGCRGRAAAGRRGR